MSNYQNYTLTLDPETHPQAGSLGSLRSTANMHIPWDASPEVARQMEDIRWDARRELHELEDEIAAYQPRGTVVGQRPRTPSEMLRARIGGTLGGSFLGGLSGLTLGIIPATFASTYKGEGRILGGASLLGAGLGGAVGFMSAPTTKEDVVFTGSPEEAKAHYAGLSPVKISQRLRSRF